MGHNINYNGTRGDYSFFSVKEIPWHGLGTILQDYPTSEEAIKFAGLNYEVAKSPNKQVFPSGKERFSENSFFTYRTDNEEVLGEHVGKDYEVVQNAFAFEFFDSIVGAKNGILYETAGALGKGERIFITAKLPDFIRVGRDDLIDQYIFLTTAHDGTNSITAAFTPIRIACNNSLNAALRTTERIVKIRHTASAHEKLKKAHKLLGISHTVSCELQEIFNSWSKIRITDANLKRLIQLALAPSKEALDKIFGEKQEELSTHFNKKIDAVLAYAFNNPSQIDPTTNGTLYGCYNAVTGYLQNVHDYGSGENKLKSLMWGISQQQTQTAFDLCNGFAQVGAAALN
ncbi:DUF932 domain-containing protein [Olivibacter sp. 47]|uniref:DUF932 domain-containing protein n=1 Tax=Olivibacter sp. 47 TaxID=3056486 RepID=UPI0025A3B951|nr:DUF932 domain-containing protein [Olivibacter sp. 47]MDM8172963.1 DUF932 domain-containing protein [Olivibacter sp. 47]